MRTPLELLALVAAAVTAGGCVITIPDSDDASTSASGSGSGGVIPDDSDAATLSWVYQSNACSHAYGVVHRGDQAIVVGARDGGPWVIRLDAVGQGVWQTTDARAGAYFAVDDQFDVATPGVVAVGRIREDDVNRGIVDVFDDSGAPVAAHTNVGGAGSGLFGVATVEGGYAVTGILAGFDLLLGMVDPGTGALTLWDAPAGNGLASSVGFGARPAPEGGVAVCGRVSTGEGGRSWTARFAADGTVVWETLGPDPGIGASSECWSLSLGPGGNVHVADYGYTGARLAAYGVDDGVALWEESEPSTGTQAISVAADGTIYVGGWSADPAADPFRSHEKGARSGWLAAFSSGGKLLWRAHAAMPLSINALRIGEGFVTVVGDLEPDSDCPHAWIGHFTLP